MTGVLIALCIIAIVQAYIAANLRTRNTRAERRVKELEGALKETE